MRRSTTVNDRMQRDYRYECVEPVGRNFAPGFNRDLTPAEMLRLGVCGGKYMTDCCDEFPASWFKHAKLAGGPRDRSLNYFGVDASQPLLEWRHGYIPTIHAAGSSGTAATTWGDERRTRILVRSAAGRRSDVTCVSFSLLASPVICGVADGNGRRCCIGHMTAGSCEKKTPPPVPRQAASSRALAALTSAPLSARGRGLPAFTRD
jgi:hypothetical protein